MAKRTSDAPAEATPSTETAPVSQAAPDTPVADLSRDPAKATYVEREVEGIDRNIVEQHLGEPGDSDAAPSPAEQ